jgi:hypothetical protein
MSKKIQAALVAMSAFASLSRAEAFPRCIEGAQEGGKHIAAAFYSRDARWQSGSVRAPLGRPVSKARVRSETVF